MVLMYVGSIELVWDGKIWKMGENTFWAFSSDMYQYTLNLYRYMLGSGHFGPTCTVHV